GVSSGHGPASDGPGVAEPALRRRLLLHANEPTSHHRQSGPTETARTATTSLWITGRTTSVDCARRTPLGHEGGVVSLNVHKASGCPRRHRHWPPRPPGGARWALCALRKGRRRRRLATSDRP